MLLPEVHRHTAAGRPSSGVQEGRQTMSWEHFVEVEGKTYVVQFGRNRLEVMNGLSPITSFPNEEKIREALSKKYPNEYKLWGMGRIAERETLEREGPPWYRTIRVMVYEIYLKEKNW